MEFFEIPHDRGWGDSQLKILLEQLAKVTHSRKIIGIFDRDSPAYVKYVEADADKIKKLGNNVFAICIPIPSGREQYSNISIEFLYSDLDLKKEKNGRCIHFDNEVEFRQSAANKGDRKLIRRDEIDLANENTKKVFDEDVGELPWIHSKTAFAQLVGSDPDFVKGIDFSRFVGLFDRLKQVLAL